MIILTIRTDKPEAEIGLYKVNSPDAKVGAPTETSELAYKKWEAHRQLAETIHQQIKDLLMCQGRTLTELEGIVVFGGPGSSTGLRIGISVANALAYSQSVPIVGAQNNNWIDIGIKRLIQNESDGTVIPEYGSPAHTTTQKK